MVASEVVVIGAGIIGLECALALLEAGYRVTLTAERIPDSKDTLKDPLYTSAWAGAQFRPHAAGGTLAAELEAETYAHFAQLVSSNAADGRAAHSVAPLPFLNTFETKPGSEPWWRTLAGSSFTEVAPGPDAAYAYRMRSFTLEPAVYLGWVLGRATAAGLRVARVGVAAGGLYEGAAAAAGVPAPLAVVNATGLGAGTLVPDSAVQPTRGQTLLVRGELAEMRTHVFARDPPRQSDRPERTPAQFVLAAIPRVGTGTTVIGSTRQPGRWDTAEDDWDSKWLCREGKRICPELVDPSRGELHVLAVNVGLRPGRQGGVRVDRQDRLVHAYGHDGAGFQMGHGTAKKVVTLVKELQPVHSNL